MNPETITMLVLLIAAVIAATIAVARAATLAYVISHLTWEIGRANAEIIDLKAREMEWKMKGKPNVPPEDDPGEARRALVNGMMGGKS